MDSESLDRLENLATLDQYDVIDIPVTHQAPRKFSNVESAGVHIAHNNVIDGIDSEAMSRTLPSLGHCY